jgi:hypothetical protein
VQNLSLASHLSANRVPTNKTSAQVSSTQSKNKVIDKNKRAVVGGSPLVKQGPLHPLFFKKQIKKALLLQKHNKSNKLPAPLKNLPSSRLSLPKSTPPITSLIKVPNKKKDLTKKNIKTKRVTRNIFGKGKPLSFNAALRGGFKKLKSRKLLKSGANEAPNKQKILRKRYGGKAKPLFKKRAAPLHPITRKVMSRPSTSSKRSTSVVKLSPVPKSSAVFPKGRVASSILSSVQLKKNKARLKRPIKRKNYKSALLRQRRRLLS